MDTLDEERNLKLEPDKDRGRKIAISGYARRNATFGINNLEQSQLQQAKDIAKLQGKEDDPEAIQQNLEDLVQATREELERRNKTG